MDVLLFVCPLIGRALSVDLAAVGDGLSTGDGGFEAKSVPIATLMRGSNAERQ